MKYKPRDLDASKNPFLSNMIVRVNLLEKEVVFHDLDGMVKDDEVVVGFVNDSKRDVKRMVVELESQVSLQLSYLGKDNRELLCKMKARTMFLYIACNIGKNKTFFYLDRNEYMKMFDIKSQTTFITHRNELIDLGVISLSGKPNWVWVNPVYIFNGIRSSFFKDLCKFENVIKTK
jgi:hypothetical protein